MNCKEFGHHYMRVLQLRRWHHIMNLKDKEESLYYGQLPILEFVRRQPGCKQKDIAEQFLLSRAAVTKSVKRMLKNELLSRDVNPNDERQFKLFLTEKGTQLTDQARACMDEIDKLTFKGFSEEELEMLDSFFLRIADNLETDYSRNKKPSELMSEIQNMIKSEEGN